MNTHNMKKIFYFDFFLSKFIFVFLNGFGCFIFIGFVVAAFDFFNSFQKFAGLRL